METPALKCELGVYQLKKKIMNWWRHHFDVTEIFSNQLHFCNDVTDGSNFITRCAFIWYWIMKCLSQSSYSTPQNHLTELFKLNIGQKILKFRKVTSANLKVWETSLYLSYFKFSGDICDEIWLQVKLIRNKNAILRRFITKNREREKCSPTPM